MSRRERLEKKLEPLREEYSREKDEVGWSKGFSVFMTILFVLSWMIFHNSELEGLEFIFLPLMLIGVGIYLHSSSKMAKLEQEIKPLEEELGKVEKDLEDLREKCSKKLKRYFGAKKVDWRILSFLAPELEGALAALAQGDFMTAKDELEDAESKLENIAAFYESTQHLDRKLGILEDFEYPSCIRYSSIIEFASNACHILYYGDVVEAKELLENAKEELTSAEYVEEEALEALLALFGDSDDAQKSSRGSKKLRGTKYKKWKFVCGDIKFFQYLFEFHYFLLKAVVEAYEAEAGAVARATEEQAERFAAAKPVEVPQTVEKVTVSAEEPEKELYRGEVRFKMGAMSQERVGTLVITNKRLKLTGKYRLRGAVPTVALKAALRAAGVGEVYEDIPLENIGWLELKKALLGGYYLEFKAKGKKYTIYTDAAQHIYNLLRQYTNA